MSAGTPSPLVARALWRTRRVSTSDQKLFWWKACTRRTLQLRRRIGLLGLKDGTLELADLALGRRQLEGVLVLELCEALLVCRLVALGRIVPLSLGHFVASDRGLVERVDLVLEPADLVVGLAEALLHLGPLRLFDRKR